MQEQCRNYKRYKAIKAPTCGCLPCRLKWYEAELSRLSARVQTLEKDTAAMDWL